MGELNLDKIERTYPGIVTRKYELTSCRISSGNMITSKNNVIIRDLTEIIENHAERTGTSTR